MHEKASQNAMQASKAYATKKLAEWHGGLHNMCGLLSLSPVVRAIARKRVGGVHAI